MWHTEWKNQPLNGRLAIAYHTGEFRQTFLPRPEEHTSYPSDMHKVQPAQRHSLESLRSSYATIILLTNLVTKEGIQASPHSSSSLTPLHAGISPGPFYDYGTYDALRLQREQYSISNDVSRKGKSYSLTALTIQNISAVYLGEESGKE